MCFCYALFYLFFLCLFFFLAAAEHWHFHWTIYHKLKCWLLCNNGHFKAHNFKCEARTIFSPSSAVYISPNWILSARLLLNLTRPFYSSSRVVLIFTALNKSISSVNFVTLLCIPFSRFIFFFDMSAKLWEIPCRTRTETYHWN